MQVTTKQASDFTKQYPLGPLLKVGTRRRVFEVKDHPDLVILAEKNNEGERSRLLAERATGLQCDAFDLLLKEEIPVAFVAQDTGTSFVARKCEILPCTLAVRTEAYGRYLKRHPDRRKGYPLAHPVVDFFLRRMGRSWENQLPVLTDPLLEYWGSHIAFYDPETPVLPDLPVLRISENRLFPREDGASTMSEMMLLALRALEVLQRRWKNEDYRLVGFTAECGLTSDGTMLLTDLVVNGDL